MGKSESETFGMGKWLWDRVWDTFQKNIRVWIGYGIRVIPDPIHGLI